MATIAKPMQGRETQFAKGDVAVKEQLPKINWLLAGAILVAGAAGITVFRWYAQNYSFQYGLDYFEAEFATYWMSLLYAELILITAVGIIGSVWVWFTRPKEVTMTPNEELSKYMLLLTALAGAGILAPVVIGLFVEADAAWHQVTIRDTDFTPTHIQLFYGIIPLLVVGGVIGFIWIHTRMPDFRNRISFPLALAVTGPIMIMPNLGLNEWGHTFFYAEELFAAPIHWGFVVLGWAVFGIGGLFIQVLNRMVKLTRVIQQEKVAQ